MNKDILLIKDWIKIPIKFSGLCLMCGQKVLSGEYGYWSKNSKSILHDNCYNLNLSKSETIKHPVDNIYTLEKNNTSDTSSYYIQEHSNKEKCFLCNKFVNLHDELIVMLLQLEKNRNDLDIFYCSYCLDNFDKNSFNKYKQALSSKMKKD